MRRVRGRARASGWWKGEGVKGERGKGEVSPTDGFRGTSHQPQHTDQNRKKIKPQTTTTTTIQDIDGVRV